MIDDGTKAHEWAESRRYVLERDNYTCQVCGHSKRSELDVHHRMPRAIHVDHSPANLITLCDGCHSTWTEGRLWQALTSHLAKIEANSKWRMRFRKGRA